MKYSLPIFCLAVISVILISCTPQNSELIVAKFGNDYTITADEFKEAYAKSVGGINTAKGDSLSQLKDYLNLYVNYKMKLRDAQVRGYDTDKEIMAELDNYKAQIARPYIEERFVVAPGAKELYENDKFEYKFRHILIKPDSISREQASKLASEIIERLKNGENFNTLVQKYSDDFATKESGGEIYYLRPSQIPMSQLNSILKQLKPGETYYKPFMSNAGYHVIQLVEKKPVRYEIRASHIVRDYKDESGNPDTAAALALMMNIKEQLNNGVSFDSLAIKYSEDPGSGPKGGDLGFFKRRSMVVAFDSVVFNLKIGQISDIIQTRFGYHIVKCTDEAKYPELSAVEEGLKSFFKKNLFAEKLERYRNQLKNDFGYKFNSEIKKYVQAKFDSTRFNSQIYETTIYNELKDQPVFSFGNEFFSVGNLFEAMKENGQYNGRFVDSLLISDMSNMYSEKLAYDYKVADLEQNDKEFQNLIDEYKNGILIFKLQEEEVWANLSIDSVGLHNYFYNNKDKYQWKDRVGYIAIISPSDSLLRSYLGKLDKGLSFDKIIEEVDTLSNDQVKVSREELVEIDKDIYSKRANILENIGNHTGVFNLEKGKWAIIELTRREAPAPKTFEEAKNELVGDYQEYKNKKADEEYTGRLTSIYKPELYYENLVELFNEKK